MNKGLSARSSRGFTLIELLVVIAIIAILAAILFPVFARAKETAKVSHCINNLKQIGNAIQGYIDDNNGRFPNAANMGREIYVEQQQGQKTLVQLLTKYANTSVARGSDPNALKVFSAVGIFACPADVGFPSGVTWDVSGIHPPTKGRVAIWEQSGTSYDYVGTDQTDWANSRNTGTKVIPMSGLAPDLGNKTWVGAPMAAVRKPTRKGVLSDAWNWHLGESGDGMESAHRNTLFADGHATRTWFKDFCYARTEPLGPWH